MAESQLLVETSTPLQCPDVMNDPQYDANTTSGGDGVSDPDACRICRGEGSTTEPLFHPCKCSGSIKHVHQDCLMEWLSHSQKKHCELCKTPFRFTKLYRADMPHSIPTTVFFHQFFVHAMRNLTVWFRFCLVITVWLGCLPWVIRQFWRLLFWFSDGAWPIKNFEMDLARNSTAMQAFEKARQLQVAALASNGTSPVTPFGAANTTSAAVGDIMDKLFSFLAPFSQVINFSSADPLAAGLLRSFYYSFGMQTVVIPEGPISNTTVSRFIKSIAPASRSSSLLSDVNFLKNLTQRPFINKLVISIAEGYIITILVVVSFILIFLIREWVIQQQPGINMGAAFNADFAPAVVDQAEQVNQHMEVRELVPLNQEPEVIRQRNIARPRRRINAQLENGDRRVRRAHEMAPDDEDRLRRPALARNAIPPGAQIQRQLTEEPRMTEEFLAIWRRADSDPKEVLRIIEDEGKVDELRYWVNAMKVLQSPRPKEVAGEPSSLPRTNPPTLEPNRTPWPSSSSNTAQAGSDQESASGESWVDIPLSLQQDPVADLTQCANGEHKSLTADDKGKGKAIEEYQEPVQESGIANLSANNNWSFGRLPAISQHDTADDGLSDGKENRRSDDVEQMVFGGESAATFQLDLQDFPLIAKEENQEWKSAQVLRVQQAKSNATPYPHEGAASVTRPPLSVLELPIPSVAGPATNESTGFNSVKFTGPIEVKGLDGTVKTAMTVEEIFENNPVSSDSEDGLEETSEPNPFAPDTDLPVAREHIVVRPPEPQSLVENVADWLWGGAERTGEEGNEGNDEHIVGDLAAEAPFVPVVNRDALVPGDVLPGQDREVVEAAIGAGIDPNDADAVEDAEDFEGIMELVGMRGPIFGLVQNALFSAFLLALTVAFGVWIPYNIGRVFLLLSVNTISTVKLALRFAFSSVALLQDLVVSVLGLISYCILALISVPLELGITAGSENTNFALASKWGAASLTLARDAFDRIRSGTFQGLLTFTNTDLFIFSAASHEALLIIRWAATFVLEEIARIVIFLFVGDYSVSFSGAMAISSNLFRSSWASVAQLLGGPGPWVISLEITKRATPLDLELSLWNGMDRFWAIVAGYFALYLAGVLYVKKGSPFSNAQVGREWEAIIIDLLKQAGGVMKVILIISIEMLVFPLYCGLLLDVALLPLFEHTTIMSRILFTYQAPLTSIFVHWFVGTCYMFHFALFVSMCRKIMRKGVLYFIRDPDDPTFHPVRDVLERNVTTQLRKILFSALVYGALVIICLGGVVWGLAYAFNGVLPIHWSSNEPVLEFPIDLLFYNFLMPLAVRFFKPSDGLHAMYKWWFQKCARILRLTWFLFDERKQDEEGHIVRRSWRAIIRGPTLWPLPVVKPNDSADPFVDPDVNMYVRQDGRYVRAPASDQVRIPKGTRIFLEVDETNNRLDGKWDHPDGMHGRESDSFKQVYIPPYFRLRICAFIISIWLFAALTGVSITIVPLVFGRQVFSKIIPTHVRKNDVYAFSIGIYILGSALYVLVHARYLIAYISDSLSFTNETPANIYNKSKAIAIRTAKIVWTYTAFIFVLPTLFALLLEFYAILPLHTYFSPTEPHTIHFVQSWTLGLLYVKLTTRLIQFYPNSRPAASLRQVTRDGYLNPDARIATRSFILPASLVLTTVLLWPWVIAHLAVMTVFQTSSDQDKVLVYRFIYPSVLAAAAILYCLYLLTLGVKGWRMKIRDEVYLIGERLHNFGDKKTGSPSEVTAGMRRVET